MSELKNKLRISTPGRVCLFGEHQDYLHLPIVASAISLRISLSGKRRKDKLIYINLPDISGMEIINLQNPMTYTRNRDYFKSVLKVLQRKGYTFSTGFDCTIEGKIPINAGTSSSSALNVTWVNFLTQMSDQAEILPAEEIGRLAYEAEVLEFSEPGGMMDQYSTAIGGIISIDFYPTVSVQKINASLKSFVLGNSNEPKDTMFILAHVKNRIIDIADKLKKEDSQFSLQTVDKENLPFYRKYISNSEFELLNGTIENRDITRIARVELEKSEIDHKLIGTLLTEHQNVLRDVLGISTAKIDRMIEAAVKAGSFGAKINGSGGGGCMFAYTPENPENVKTAIESVGGEAFIVHSDSGTGEEPWEEAE